MLSLSVIQYKKLPSSNFSFSLNVCFIGLRTISKVVELLSIAFFQLVLYPSSLFFSIPFLGRGRLGVSLKTFDIVFFRSSFLFIEDFLRGQVRMLSLQLLAELIFLDLSSSNGKARMSSCK